MNITINEVNLILLICIGFISLFLIVFGVYVSKAITILRQKQINNYNDILSIKKELKNYLDQIRNIKETLTSNNAIVDNNYSYFDSELKRLENSVDIIQAKINLNEQEFLLYLSDNYTITKKIV